LTEHSATSTFSSAGKINPFRPLAVG